MINCRKFYDILNKDGIDFFTGVPDSLLKNFCAYIADNVIPEKNIIAANEGSAVALAAGYYLATGKIGLVYMQNSGLGNAVNPLISLADKEIYSIPMLLLVGWRAEPGIKDEPQHVKMGKITLKILETMRIPYKILNDNFENIIKEAKDYMKRKKSPYAIVVKKNTFGKYELKNRKEANYGLNREEAIKTIVPLLQNADVIVSTTGMTSRELFEHREASEQGHEKDFLTVGSMGYSSSIALGIALEKPNRQVYCFDGDGALIMHMGALAIIGQLKPKNFRHIVFNNYAHDSVGGQPTAADSIDIPKIAKANGYKDAFSVKTRKEIIEKINKIRSMKGPVLLEIRVKKGARHDLGRPTNTPRVNKKLFMDFLSEKEFSTGKSENKLKDIFTENKVKDIFLVTGGKSFALSGAKTVFEKLLSSYNITRFSNFGANPNIKDLERGVKLFKKGNYDMVVAIGGGSVIDMAKLINIFSAQSDNPTEYIKKGKRINKKGKPLVAMPTTAGSGSEATHFAVIYIDKVKYSVAHKYLLPDYAIVDPAFTMNLPRHITASAGMDALCQAIESYWSIHSSGISKEYSRRAIKLAINNLADAFGAPTLKSRQAMSQAAYLAGKAINITKTTAPHAISYMLTSHFGVPHGHAVGLTMGKIFKYNSMINEEDTADKRGWKYVKKTMDELCALLGVSNAVSADKKLEKLMKTIGLKTRLKKMGVKNEDIDLIVRDVNLERFKNNPRIITEEKLQEILKSIL